MRFSFNTNFLFTFWKLPSPLLRFTILIQSHPPTPHNSDVSNLNCVKTHFHPPLSSTIPLSRAHTHLPLKQLSPLSLSIYTHICTLTKHHHKINTKSNPRSTSNQSLNQQPISNLNQSPNQKSKSISNPNANQIQKQQLIKIKLIDTNTLTN